MLSYPEVLGWAGPELVWRAAPHHQVATQNTSHSHTTNRDCWVIIMNLKFISNNTINRERLKKNVEKNKGLPLKVQKNMV